MQSFYFLTSGEPLLAQTRLATFLSWSVDDHFLKIKIFKDTEWFKNVWRHTRISQPEYLVCRSEKENLKEKTNPADKTFLIEVQSVNTLSRLCLPRPKESFASHSSFWREHFQNPAEEITEWHWSPWWNHSNNYSTESEGWWKNKNGTGNNGLETKAVSQSRTLISTGQVLKSKHLN